MKILNKLLQFKQWIIRIVSGSFYKLLCKIGWHAWSFSIQDCIDEFGGIPNDSRLPKTAKCDRCGINYR